MATYCALLMSCITINHIATRPNCNHLTTKNVFVLFFLLKKQYYVEAKCLLSIKHKWKTLAFAKKTFRKLWGQHTILAWPHWWRFVDSNMTKVIFKHFGTSIFTKLTKLQQPLCPNVSTPPITAMGCHRGRNTRD